MTTALNQQKRKEDTLYINSDCTCTGSQQNGTLIEVPWMSENNFKMSLCIFDLIYLGARPLLVWQMQWIETQSSHNATSNHARSPNELLDTKYYKNNHDGK